MRTALIYLQENPGGLHPVCAELAAKAAELADDTAGVLICRELTGELTAALQSSGLSRVYLYTFPAVSVFRQEAHRAAVTDCVRRLKPEILLFGATLEGRSLAPMIGAAFKTGVTADCTELSLNSEGQLVQTRPAFGGRIMASILTRTARPQIATVRQGVFRAQPQAAGDCEIDHWLPVCLAVQVTEEGLADFIFNGTPVHYAFFFTGQEGFFNFIAGCVDKLFGFAYIDKASGDNVWS